MQYETHRNAKNGFWKRVGINIPFVLMIAAMVALFSGCLLMWFYAIASLFAFKSSMIFLILAGAGTLCLGLGLALIPAYKKYYDFYNKKWDGSSPTSLKKKKNHSRRRQKVFQRLLHTVEYFACDNRTRRSVYNHIRSTRLHQSRHLG